MNPPVLTTQRLRLEKLASAHKAALYRLLVNPKVHEYFPKPLSREEAQAFYETVQRRYRRDGYCFYAVIRRADDQFLGICGLLSQTIDGEKEVEVGYRLSDEFWNQGYGTEAAGGCIRYAKETLGLASVISLIRPVNRASIRVAEKNGLVPEKQTLFQERPHLVYRLQLN